MAYSSVEKQKQKYLFLNDARVRSNLFFFSHISAHTEKRNRLSFYPHVKLENTEKRIKRQKYRMLQNINCNYY